MRRIASAIICTIGLGGCVTKSATTPEPIDTSGDVTLSLQRDEDGNLEYCDAATGDCVGGLPNENDCQTLEVTINTSTGATCERCLDASGAAITSTCSGEAEPPSVECALITIPEPDCVVCAYVNGAVIFSSCNPEEPPSERCETYSAVDGTWAEDPSGGSNGGTTCQVCYDENGQVIRDDCGNDCSAVLCPQVFCPEGYQETRQPGSCCPYCEPIVDCSQAVCSREAIPDCGDGYILVQDPSDCCTYRCEPTDCTAVMCPQPATSDCPPGYTWRAGEYPYCCGGCYPDNEPTYCTADRPCPEGYECSQDSVCDCRPDSSGGCSPDANCGFGYCKPIGYQCPMYDQPNTRCDGWWDYGGRDAYGCPLPPVCYCWDGTVSRDGTCQDSCAAVDCAQMEIRCEPGYHAEYGYPYCCGACVPDGECWTANGSTSSNGSVCADVVCDAGFHQEVGADCCPTCVQDPTYCSSSAECRDSEFCTVETGDCMRHPSCYNDAGTACPAVCYGFCKPRG
jgi:hypothetical protein